MKAKNALFVKGLICTLNKINFAKNANYSAKIVQTVIFILINQLLKKLQIFLLCVSNANAWFANRDILLLMIHVSLIVDNMEKILK